MELAKKILEEWGIRMPEEDYIEFLQENYPQNFYFIDQCPFEVGEKHSQIEILYQDVLDGTIPKEKFHNYEATFIKALTTLWLYNDVFISSNIADIQLKKNKRFDEVYANDFLKLKLSLKKSNILRVDELKDLELLLQICFRDLGHVEFYFQQYELFVVPMWSCFAVYFKNLSKVGIVEKIINTSGLYIRSI